VVRLLGQIADRGQGGDRLVRGQRRRVQPAVRRRRLQVVRFHRGGHWRGFRGYGVRGGLRSARTTWRSSRLEKQASASARMRRQSCHTSYMVGGGEERGAGVVPDAMAAALPRAVVALPGAVVALLPGAVADPAWRSSRSEKQSARVRRARREKSRENVHYRNSALYRVPAALPSAFYRVLGKADFAERRTRQSPTLGKDLIYRVRDTRHSPALGKADFAERRTRQSPTLGKDLIYRVRDTRHSPALGKDCFAESQTLGKDGSRQRAVSGCL
jgi:hypothetical protein